jgi:hypothetical protein
VAAGAVALLVLGYRVLTYGTPPATVTEVAAPATATDLVASGMIGTQSWQIRLRPSPDVRGPDQVCWFGQGPAFGFPRNEDTPGECGKFQDPPETYGDSAVPGQRPDPVRFFNFGLPAPDRDRQRHRVPQQRSACDHYPHQLHGRLSAFPPWKWHKRSEAVTEPPAISRGSTT